MAVRKFPIYIVVDCSGGMVGDPLKSVKTGIRALHANLIDDPTAVESVYLSVITYGSNATQVVPLTSVGEFVPPDLRAGGTASLGEALGLLSHCIKKEVQFTATEEQKADWHPMVLLLSYRCPTDEWQSKAQELKQFKMVNIIAVGCGRNADVEILKKIADTVLMMREMSREGFKEFFEWVLDFIYSIGFSDPILIPAHISVFSSSFRFYDETSHSCRAASGEAEQKDIDMKAPPVSIQIVP